MGSDIFDLCDAFTKVATVSLVENDRFPLLKELSEIKDFDERVEWCKERWNCLGEGSARAVFQYSDKAVLKVAINKKGYAQNHTESLPSAQTPCTAKILAADGAMKWLLFENNESITEKQFKSILGFSFKQFCDELWQVFDNNSDYKEIKHSDTIREHPFFKCVCKLVIDNDLLLGDLASEGKISSYGEVDGHIVIRDFGLCRRDWAKFYSDDSSSSSRSTPKSTPESKTK
jgi:hypothetical protein